MNAPVDEQLAVLARVADILEGLGIPYMLSGSLAASFYSQPRMTRDIDLVVDFLPAQVPSLAAALAAEFYCDETSLTRAAERRSLANVIHDATLIKVDLIVRKDDPFHRAEFDRRTRQRLGTVTADVVTREDLILAKLAWLRAGGSAVQREDIQRLLVDAPTLDWAYVHRWAHELGLDALLTELRQ